MTINRSTTIVGLILFFSALSLAQTQSGNSPSPAQDKSPKQAKVSTAPRRIVMQRLPAEVTPTTVPNGKGSWVIQISTGGGFADIPSGGLTVTSAGEVACENSKAVTDSFLPSQLADLSSLIVKMRIHGVDQVSTSTSFCNDCQTTSLTLSRRESDQKVKSYLVSWDPLTKSKLPAELQQLYETVLGLSACERRDEPHPKL
jgi:hypothetical protein